MVARKGYKLTEAGEIPEDWEVQPLSKSIKNLQAGVSVNSELDSMSQIYILKTSAVYDGKVDFTHVKPVPSKETSRVKCHVEQGCLLISRMNTPDLVGACGYVERTIENVFLPDRLWQSIASNWRTDFLWLTYLLNAPQQKAEIKDIATGTSNSMKNIAKGKFLSLPIPFPPHKEQTAIATALSDADALIEALEQSIAKKRHIKQGAMQELLTGKKRLPGFEGEWKEKLFCELAYPSRVRFTPSKKNKHDFCIELEHIEQCTGSLLSHTETTPESSLKSKFESGDILFGKLRAYLRKYWLANRSGVCSTEFWVLKPIKPYVTPEYIYQLVQTDAFIEAASTAYGTHMPRSDWNVVKEFEVKVPPLDDNGNPTEQTAIAAVLSDMDEEIIALEAKLSKARQIKAGMMQELLTGRIRLV